MALLTLIPALFCSLVGNNLGEVGGIAVAKALKTNTSLQKLESVPWSTDSNCPGGVLDNNFCPNLLLY